MRLPNYKADFSPYFNRPNKEGRVKVPNNVKIVVGTETFDCSGPLLARHSSVLLDLIVKQDELYLDDYVDCVEGLLDCVDLLYGAEVEISMQNIQTLFKFSVIYKIEGVFNLCLEWVSQKMSLENMSLFYKIGLFVKSVGEKHDDYILESCKKIILRCSTGDLFKVRKLWYEDDNIMKFMFDKHLFLSTFPLIIDWMDSEKRVLIALDNIKQNQLEDLLGMLGKETQKLTAKMSEIGESAPCLKRIIKLQASLADLLVQDQLDPSNKRIRVASSTVPPDVCVPFRQPPALTPRQCNQLRAQIYAYKLLSKKRPLPQLVLDYLDGSKKPPPRGWFGCACQAPQLPTNSDDQPNTASGSASKTL